MTARKWERGKRDGKRERESERPTDRERWPTEISIFDNNTKNFPDHKISFGESWRYYLSFGLTVSLIKNIRWLDVKFFGKKTL